MSKRTAERNKAIKLAWEREQKLVSDGKGTRDWTKEQQQDILNPNKGKAYDLNGIAFEGQHMKSVGKYPEYQSDPNNIQFLTHDEHFEAHKGNWQNQCNWYYNPITKEYIDFGEKKLPHCEIIELSDPVVVISNTDNMKKTSRNKRGNYYNNDRRESPPTSDTQDELSDENEYNSDKVSNEEKENNSKNDNIANRIIYTIFKPIAKYIKFREEHPIVSSVFETTVALSTSVLVDGIINNDGKKSTNTSNVNSNDSNIKETTSVELANDKVVEDLNNAPAATLKNMILDSVKRKYTENDVPSGPQRYHTKEGIKWKQKPEYHRTGKGNINDTKIDM